jgi:hypothetical protein
MGKQKDRKVTQNKRNISRITLWLPDQHALNEVLTAGKIMCAGGAPWHESDGTYRIEIYTSRSEGKKIIALGYRHEVDETYGEMLAKRQDEVSKIDRFKGGKVKPTGIGEKR